MSNKWLTVAIVVTFCSIAIAAAIVAGNRKNEIESLKEQLLVQNVQLTEQNRAAISDAYKAGLIACGNEDIQFLNDTAYEYRGTLFARILRNWAKTWAYDEDRLQEMVEDYMSGEVH